MLLHKKLGLCTAERRNVLGCTFTRDKSIDSATINTCLVMMRECNVESTALSLIHNTLTLQNLILVRNCCLVNVYFMLLHFDEGIESDPNLICDFVIVQTSERHCNSFYRKPHKNLLCS